MAGYKTHDQLKAKAVLELINAGFDFAEAVEAFDEQKKRNIERHQIMVNQQRAAAAVARPVNYQAPFRLNG